MSNDEKKSSVIAGLLSSALFLVIYTIGLGFIFMFLPTIPLFMLGLRLGSRPVINAIGIAALIIAVSIGLPSAIVYTMLLGVPAWYITHHAIRWRMMKDNQTKEWFPIIPIFINISLSGILFIAVITAYYAGTSEGLPGMMAEQIDDALKPLKAEYGDEILVLIREWSFLIFAVTIWLWNITLFLHAWVANQVLHNKGLAQRPHFTLTICTIPQWVLYLVAIAATASLIGSESMQFLGKTSLISLMLPYFFLGCALMHHSTQGWTNQKILLFVTYFMILTQIWPAMMIAAYGIWYQIKNLNKHLPEDGSSSKN